MVEESPFVEAPHETILEVALPGALDALQDAMATRGFLVFKEQGQLSGDEQVAPVPSAPEHSLSAHPRIRRGLDAMMAAIAPARPPGTRL